MWTQEYALQTKSYRGGFTLIELLVAIAIIAVLSGSVIMAINPRLQLAGARDAERKHISRELSQAMYQRLIDTWEMPSESQIPACSSDDVICAKPVCKQSISESECTDNGGVSLSVLSTESYVASLPTDIVMPNDARCTGYMVYKHAGRPKVFSANLGKMPGDTPEPECACGDTSGGGSPPAPGNGTIDPGEECDDGNTDPGDGCDADGNIESGYGCTGEPSVCNICINTYIVDGSSTSAYVAISTTDLLSGTYSNTEFTSGDYTAVSADDSNYVEMYDSDYPYHRFVVTFVENKNNITQMNIAWKGHAIGEEYAFSFPPETLIRTEEGPHSLGELYAMQMAGEPLPSVSIYTGGSAARGTIREVFRHALQEPLVEIVLQNDRIILATPSHPFLLHGHEEEYQQAEHLQPGTALMGEDGTAIAVATVRTVSGAGSVYDLSITEHPNFLLDAGVFVHNMVAAEPTYHYGQELHVKENGIWQLKSTGTAEIAETLSAQYAGSWDAIINASNQLEFAATAGSYHSTPNTELTIRSYYAEVTVQTCVPAP